MSLVEAAANVIAGHGVAVVTQIPIFPIFGSPMMALTPEPAPDSCRVRHDRKTTWFHLRSRPHRRVAPLRGQRPIRCTVTAIRREPPCSASGGKTSGQQPEPPDYEQDAEEHRGNDPVELPQQKFGVFQRRLL